MEDNPTLAMRELLQRRAPKAEVDAPDRRLADTFGEEDYTAYANGRIGSRPQLCVVFRFANGRVLCLSYAHFFSVESDDPAQGCTVTFLPSTQVKIRGQRLAMLADSLCNHRAAEIVEAPRSGVLSATETAVVDEIEVVQIRNPEPSIRNRREMR